MSLKLSHHLLEISELHRAYAEDLSDQLMSKYTSLLLIVFACLLVMKQYIFKPIQCWVPAEWPRPWEEYTENFCWIQDTYHVAYALPGHPGLQARKESEISYYQWVPILLALQAILVLIPRVFWCFAAAQSGYDPHHIVKLAMELEEAKSSKKREKLATCLSAQLNKSIKVAASAHCGSYCLFVCYLVSKLAYLLCGLGHLFFMKIYLGFDELGYGMRYAADLVQGRQWQHTRIFPRITFCDVPVRNVGQWNTRSLQCVLPTNMISEKIYIFLWFWVVFCMALSLAFTVHWVVGLTVVPLRVKFVNKLLQIARPLALGKEFGSKRWNGGTEDGKTHRLLRLLQLDGVFVLQMIAYRCGILCAACILENLAKHAKNLDKYHQTEFGNITPNKDGTLPIRGRNGRDAASGGGGECFLVSKSDA